LQSGSGRIVKIILTADEVEPLVSFVRDYIQFAEEMAGPNYGPYMGGDPRNFMPDPEDATPEEIERHREVCEIWARGERNIPRGFGLSSSWDRAKDERCRRLRRLGRGAGIASRFGFYVYLPT
jgi:hypothetical protein